MLSGNLRQILQGRSVTDGIKSRHHCAVVCYLRSAQVCSTPAADSRFNHFFSPVELWRWCVKCEAEGQMDSCNTGKLLGLCLDVTLNPCVFICRVLSTSIIHHCACLAAASLWFMRLRRESCLFFITLVFLYLNFILTLSQRVYGFSSSNAF